MIDYRVIIDNGPFERNYDFQIKLPFMVEEGFVFERIFEEDVQLEDGEWLYLEPIHKNFEVDAVKTFINHDGTYEVQLYCLWV